MLIKLMNAISVEKEYNRDTYGYMLYKQANIQQVTFFFLKKSDYIKAIDMGQKAEERKREENNTNKQGGTNNSTGTYAQYSFMKDAINSILEPAYSTWKQYRNATDWTTRYSLSFILESQGNNLCDICEQAMQMDKMQGNVKGQEEDRLFWRLGLTFIGTRK